MASNDVPAVPDDADDVKLDFVASSAHDGAPLWAATESTGGGNAWAGNDRAPGAAPSGAAAASSSDAAAGGAGVGPGGPNAQPDGKTHFWNIAHYRAYFDVDTAQVFQRIFAACTFRRDLFDDLEEKPDLYGPFWLATTNIFLMAMVSNALSWVENGKNQGEGQWSGDINKIMYAAAIFYGYIFGGGALLWFWLRVISSAQISLVALWAIYGYSMAVWLPVTFLALVPNSIFLWGLCLATSLYSALVLIINVRQAVQESLVVARQSVTLLVMFLAHSCVGFALRLFVFTYEGGDPPAATPSPPPPSVGP